MSFGLFNLFRTGKKRLPRCGKYVSYRDSDSSNGVITFLAADCEKKLYAVMQKERDTNTVEMFQWFVNRDESIHETIAIPLCWPSGLYANLARSLIEEGRYTAHCLSCNLEYRNIRLVDAASDTWGFKQLICPEGHKLISFVDYIIN